MGFSRTFEANVSRSQRALQEQERLGGLAQNEFFQRSLGFDAQSAAEESARGIVGGLRPQLQQNLEFARGQAVGGGRLDTGFFDIDRGRIFEDFNDRVANAVARNALQAQQLNLQNIGQIGTFGESTQNRFVNLLGGSLDRATAEENARRQGGGLFGKLLGGAAGLATGIATGNPFAGLGVGQAVSGAFGGGGGGNSFQIPQDASSAFGGRDRFEDKRSKADKRFG